MVMPANILRVTHRGTVATDQWQTASYFRPQGAAPSTPIPSAFGTDVANLARTMWSSMAPYTSAMVSFASVHLEWFGSGGTLAAVLDAVPVGGTVGGSAAGNHPPQTAIVVSTRSASPGPAFRGRMYWPLLSGTVATATGLFPSADATSIAGFVRTFMLGMSGISSWGAAGWAPQIVSQTGGGQSVPLTALKVGNAFDTQRRRRNKVVETYSTVTVP